MNNDRLLMKGMLQVRTEELVKLDILAENELMVIRAATNPLTVSDIADMNLQNAQEALTRLIGIQSEIIRNRSSIKKIENELNG